MPDLARDRARLLELINEIAVVRGRVTLSSGLQADVYVDLRRITMHHEAAPLVGRLMLDATKDLDFDVVGGLTLGADPVATAMLHVAAAQGRALDACAVRKAQKTHGMQRQVEGPGVDGRRILVVDDTSTTGNSPVTAATTLREAGAEVAGVALIVDRGAADVIAAEGFSLTSVYDMAELDIV